LERYTLVITEKPNAANRIADAIDINGKAKKIVTSGVPSYQAYNNGKVVVVPALGHLYTIKGRQKIKRDYPVFDYQWVPKYQADRKASMIRPWLKVISDLARNAEEFVDACDYDIEGSVIGYNILKHACGGKEQVAKRMKYSTLTEKELREAYSNLLPKIDFALVEAGLTRHEVDWLYGINISRALTQAVREVSGKYANISAGRVQGPTLKFVESLEGSIQSFVPKPYWKIKAKVEVEGQEFEIEYEKSIETSSEARKIREKCKTNEGQIEKIKTELLEKHPLVPFDLVSLQREAYRLFKLIPIRTSKILQKLYLDALISYPRTSSQKLPASIGYRSIFTKLSKSPIYASYAREMLSRKKMVPHEGKKIDSAHPAIYPTGELPSKPLLAAEECIFDLIIKRFFSVFGEPAIEQKIEDRVNIKDCVFLLHAERILSEGWMKFYKPYILEKKTFVPNLIEGQKIIVKRVFQKLFFTQPPSRFNPSSLLLKMEKEHIGTKATQAATIQTLLDRRYIEGTSELSATRLGFEVADVLTNFCSEIATPDLTRELEEKMEAIQRGNQNRQNVLQEVRETLKSALLNLKTNKKTVGEVLNQAIQKIRLQEKTVGNCTKCFDGKLLILRSKKSGKRFVGCSNYFVGKCNSSFPLPQTGSIRPLGFCKTCGFPRIMILTRGKRPWRLCLNKNCKGKGE
jgi:DNA topoisomerase-1